MSEPVVDYGLCTGCGACVDFCPDVFELRDEKAWVIDPSKCDSCNCEEFATLCPVDAIEMQD